MKMAETFTVTSGGLNLHTEPRRSAHVDTALTTGDTMVIDRHEGVWLHGTVVGTRSGKGLGQQGWVDGKFGELIPAAVAKTDTSTLLYVVGAVVAAVVVVVAWLLAR
jgi:hypothetical protein